MYHQSMGLIRNCFLVTAFFVALPPAAATTMKRASLANLVRAADAIVVARALNRESFWDGGRIKTRVRVAVLDTWRGQALLGENEEVEVIVLGGVVGEIGQSVHGIALLPTGRERVLCLKRMAEGGYRVVGMRQGEFEIRGSRKDPTARVRQVLKGLHWHGPPLDVAMPNTLQELKRAMLEVADDANAR